VPSPVVDRQHTPAAVSLVEVHAPVCFFIGIPADRRSHAAGRSPPRRVRQACDRPRHRSGTPPPQRDAGAAVTVVVHQPSSRPSFGVEPDGRAAGPEADGVREDGGARRAGRGAPPATPGGAASAPPAPGRCGHRPSRAATRPPAPVGSPRPRRTTPEVPGSALGPARFLRPRSRRRRRHLSVQPVPQPQPRPIQRSAPATPRSSTA